MNGDDTKANCQAAGPFQQQFNDNPNPIITCQLSGEIDHHLTNPADRALLDVAVQNTVLLLPLDHIEITQRCWTTKKQQRVARTIRHDHWQLNYVPNGALERVVIYAHQTDAEDKLLVKALRNEQDRGALAELVGQEHKIYNRRFFFSMLEHVHVGVQKGLAKAYGVLLLDINDFKKFNDNYGHDYGNAALHHLSSILIAVIRDNCEASGQIISRLGGDEFAVLLSNPPRGGAADILEEIGFRLRQELAKKPLQHFGQEVEVTVSIGAEVYGGGPQTIDEVMHAADRAMYYNKRSGNRETVTFPVDVPSTFHLPKRPGR